MSIETSLKQVKFNLEDDHCVVTFLSNKSVRITMTNEDTSCRYMHTLDMSSLEVASGQELKMKKTDVIIPTKKRDPNYEKGFVACLKKGFAAPKMKAFVKLHFFNSTDEDVNVNLPDKIIKVDVVRKGNDRYLNVWIEGKIEKTMLQARFADSDELTPNDLNKLRTDILREVRENEKNSVPFSWYFFGSIGFMIALIIFAHIHSDRINQRFDCQWRNILHHDQMLTDHQRKLASHDEYQTFLYSKSIAQQNQIQSWVDFEQWYLHIILLLHLFASKVLIPLMINAFVMLGVWKSSEGFNPNA